MCKMENGVKIYIVSLLQVPSEIIDEKLRSSWDYGTKGTQEQIETEVLEPRLRKGIGII